MVVACTLDVAVERPTLDSLRTPSWRYQVGHRPARVRRAWSDVKTAQAESEASPDHLSDAKVAKEESETGKFFCNHICQGLLPKECFSKHQKAAPAWRRACTACIDRMYIVEHSRGMVCDWCQYPRGHGLFPRECLKSNCGDVVCFWCILKDETHDAHNTSFLHRGFFQGLEAYFWKMCSDEGVRKPYEVDFDEGTVKKFGLWPTPVWNSFLRWTKEKSSPAIGASRFADQTFERAGAASGGDEVNGERQGCEPAYRCRSCDRDLPREMFSKSQLNKRKDTMICQHCSLGPDIWDSDMLDSTSDPPGWHSDTTFYLRFFDKDGRALQKYVNEGIPRMMKLAHIRFSQRSCSGWFKEDGSSIMTLVEALKAAGDETPLRDAGKLIRVCLYKGRYWTLDHRRLWCLKTAFGDDRLVRVLYFHEPAFLEKLGRETGQEYNSFVEKFSTELDGKNIFVNWGTSRNRGRDSGRWNWHGWH